MKAARIVRLWHSARHYQARQICRRLFSLGRRRVLSAAARMAPGIDRRYRSNEIPLLRSRKMPRRLRRTPTSRLHFVDGKAHVELLGASVALEPAVDWRGRGETLATSHLRRFHLHYMDYLSAADDQLFLSLVRDWIRSNRPFLRDQRTDGFASYCVSIRVVSWLEELHKRRDSLAQNAIDDILASLVEQVEYLYHHLERDIGGNHLIRNLHCLMWASAVLTHPYASRWRRRAERILSVELRRQFLDDGMHLERCPYYHLHVLMDLWEIAQTDPSAQLSAELKHTIDQASSAASAVITPDRNILRFSDGLFDDGDNTTVDSLDRAGLLAREHQSGARVLTDSSMARFCSNAQSFFYDFGTIEPAYLPGHAHADTFNLVWYVGSVALIVDPGVYEYEATRWREWSRSTAAHNCLTIATENQADVYGSFRVGRRHRVTIHNMAVRPDSLELEASHDGYLATHGAIHRRRVRVENQRVTITDTVSRERRGTARASLLLHPECRLERESSSRVRIMRDGNAGYVTCTEPLIALESTYFPRVGELQPAIRLAAELGTERDTSVLELLPVTWTAS